METLPPAAAVWGPTPPSLSRLCYASVWTIAVAYFTNVNVPPAVAFMSCPILVGIHTLWT
jgi:hypothetical protein